MIDIFYQAGQFLIQTCLELYVFLVCLRILLHWANVSYANPILMAVARVTSPCLRPIYSIIPTFNGLDLAAVILLSFLSMVKIAMLFWWKMGFIPISSGLILLAFAEVLKQFVDIFFFIIILFSLMSWFNPLTAPAVVEIVFKVSGPLMQLAQRLLPPVSGIDFSPFVVMVSLRLLTMLIVNPLSQIGTMLLNTTLTNSL